MWCSFISKRPNHPEIALESEPVTEQPKANTEAEGKNEEEGAGGDEVEDGEEADAEDSDGESEEEEEGGCCSCCNKASSPIFIISKTSLKNLQPLIGSCTLCCCLGAVCAFIVAGKKGTSRV